MRPGRLASAYAALACASLAWACGGRRDAAPPVRDDAAAPADVAAVVELPARTLGMPDHAAFLWRRRGGHPAYRLARKAEAAGQWENVATTCKQALTADPGHLEAEWLLAVALAKIGKLDQVLEPLQAAVAGDFGKWGHASLEQPALAAFRETPTGKAWLRRVEQDRALYTAQLARSIVVTAGGELFAYDPKGPRWHRLTHTYGAVIGALRVPEASQIVYVTRQRARGKKDVTLAVGVANLARGRTLNPIELGTAGPIAVAYAAKKNAGVWIGTRTPRGMTWQLLEESGKLGPLPPKSARPPGPWLEITGKLVRSRAIPVYDITADFDDKGLASAIRIGRSNRILSIPSPGLIDGNSLQWSADRAHLAFVAQLDDQCGKAAVNAAAFVSDATTGALRELERAAGGLTVDWLADGRPVVAGDKGVSIYDLADAEPVPLEGADGLLVPRVRPKCTPSDDGDAPPPDDPDLPEAAASPGAAPAAGAAAPPGTAPAPAPASDPAKGK